MSTDPKTTPRQRARAQVMHDIKRIARDQLASEGGAALSLRAIARELGIVSSAVYRYVPSRDELLTMLIEDAYNSLGEAAEAADARCDRTDLTGRWMAIGTAIRSWAVQRPSEYTLIYGSPVPGYAAPPDRTIVPGRRVSLLLLSLISAAPATGPTDSMPEPLRRDLRAIRAALGFDLDDALLVRGILAWTALFGMISFEVFGQYTNSIEDHGAHFGYQLGRLGMLIGL